jgi:hypothetical protein
LENDSLAEPQFFGHGIGLGNAERFIKSLNSRRKSGNVRSAYLMSQAGRPDFRRLAEVMHSPQSVTVWKMFPPATPPQRGEARNGFYHISGKMFV